LDEAADFLQELENNPNVDHDLSLLNQLPYA